MIKPLGHKPSLKNTYHAVLTGYLLNYALPRLGELSRCIALGRKENIPVDKLLGTVIAERAFDLISMFIIMGIMFFTSGDIMGSFLNEYIIAPLELKFTSAFNYRGILLILFFVLIIILSLIYIYRKRIRQTKIYQKTIKILKGIIKGLRSFYAMDNKIEFIIHTLIIWTCYTIMTWAVFYTISSTSVLNFGDAVFFLVIGSLGMAAPVQGGIGAFHWIISRGMLFVYGIELKDGLTYATLSHGAQLILIAVLGTISFNILLGKKKQKKASMGSTNK